MVDDTSETTRAEHGRAPRFKVQTELRYREKLANSWLGGWTENISRTGVLFFAEHLLEPKTEVELNFELPVEVSNEPAAEVFCLGYIVRQVPPAEPGALPALAAMIVDYVFRRGPSARVV